MRRLRYFEHDAASDIQNVAVGTSKRGSHAMMAYRRPSDEVAVLHVFGNLDLRNDPPGKHFACWAEPDLDEENAILVAAFCEDVAHQAAGLIRYGFSDPRNYFRMTGGRIEVAAAGQIGLTCATFVLAVFDCLGLDLINYASWRKKSSRRDIAVRQELLKDVYEDDFASAGQAEAEIRSPRYPPFQVLAAAAGTRPMKYRRARRVALRIERRLAATAGP